MLEVGAMLVVLGVGYLASFLLENEWHLAHYLTFLAVILLVVGAILVYRRSRQVLP